MFSNSGDKTPSGKNPKGNVTVEAFRGRLRLRFRFNGQRYSLGLGLSDTKANRRAADARAKQIEDDMRLQLTHGGDYFDSTLAKYRPETTLSVSDPDIEPKLIPKLKVLWVKYVDYKSLNASPKTVNGTYQPVTSYLEKCPTDGLQGALGFRRELLEVTGRRDTHYRGREWLGVLLLLKCGRLYSCPSDCSTLPRRTKSILSEKATILWL